MYLLRLFNRFGIMNRVKRQLIVGSGLFTGLIFFIIKRILASIISEPLTTSFFTIDIVRNEGYIFGFLGSQYSIMFICQLLTVIASLFILYKATKKNIHNNFWFIFSQRKKEAGNTGNALDWFVNGYVIDYVSFNIPLCDFYTNLEDILIQFGMVIIIFHIIFYNERLSKIYK